MVRRPRGSPELPIAGGTARGDREDGGGRDADWQCTQLGGSNLEERAALARAQRRAGRLVQLPELVPSSNTRRKRRSGSSSMGTCARSLSDLAARSGLVLGATRHSVLVRRRFFLRPASESASTNGPPRLEHPGDALQAGAMRVVSRGLALPTAPVSASPLYSISSAFLVWFGLFVSPVRTKDSLGRRSWKTLPRKKSSTQWRLLRSFVVCALRASRPAPFPQYIHGTSSPLVTIPSPGSQWALSGRDCGTSVSRRRQLSVRFHLASVSNSPNSARCFPTQSESAPPSSPTLTPSPPSHSTSRRRIHRYASCPLPRSQMIPRRRPPADRHPFLIPVLLPRACGIERHHRQFTVASRGRDVPRADR